MHVILDRLVHITCLARKYGQIELPIYAQKYEHFYQDSEHIDKLRFYLRWLIRLNDAKRFYRELDTTRGIDRSTHNKLGNVSCACIKCHLMHYITLDSSRSLVGVP
jgi:hypothetical protein